MSDIILKQNIDRNDLSIFIRDLSSNLNVNLKHMIEDCLKTDVKNDKKNDKNKKNNKKKQVIKKKDLIIQEQNKIREKKLYEDDIKKIDFLYQSINYSKPLANLDKLNTQKAVIHFKFRLLSDKKLNIRFKILLYFDLKDTEKEYLNDEYCKTLEKIKSKLEDYEYKSFMMKELSDYLPPLNNTKKQLDEWQVNVVKYIQKKESVIVRAPTSAGKSFVAMATGVLHKRVLYVCPAKPVAFQVGAHFMHMGYKVHYFVENLSHNSYDPKTNIFIGTPLEIENNLYRLKEKFDYAVFDEIHNLNSEKDGHIYENIIKLIDCNFLALSATIKNIDVLKDLFMKINDKDKNKDKYKGKKINYVEYNKRFINHQKWVWDDKKNKLVKLHPLSCFDKVDKYGFKNSLNFTPDDCHTLWEVMEENLDEDLIENISPDEYFTEDRLLTLDDCKDYETKLLNVLSNNPENFKDIVSNFKVDVKGSNGDDIISFIRECKTNNMLPMIMFHTDENICRNIFDYIYNYLDKKELEEYPFHYEILEKKQEYYQKYLEEREQKKSNIKVSSSNAQYEIKEKMEIFDRKEKTLFIQNILKFYDQKILFTEKNENIDNKIRKIQLTNLKKEMNEFLQNPDFNSQDVFKKHKDFIFTNGNPMSGDTIRNVRREIMKTLGIKIPYESPLFQMLKRGIGLYTESMPDEYNWILQKLLAKREIGIVISDKTLCLGIDLPIRSSCFLGIDNVEFSKDEYLQMSGRAGRRGLDTRGNIIFFGDIDFKKLGSGELPEIKGSDKILYKNNNVLSKLNLTFKNIDNIYLNTLNSKKEIVDTVEIKELTKASWFLRGYKNSNILLNKLFDIECELYKINNQYDQETYLLNHLNELLLNHKINDIYKLKKINEFKDIYLLKEYVNILIYVYNHINHEKYLTSRKVIKELFKNLNHILFTSVV